MNIILHDSQQVASLLGPCHASFDYEEWQAGPSQLFALTSLNNGSGIVSQITPFGHKAVFGECLSQQKMKLKQSAVIFNLKIFLMTIFYICVICVLQRPLD